MTRIGKIQRIVNIINKAYEYGYKFDEEELSQCQAEAVKILTNFGIEPTCGNTKEALVANMLEIQNNGLEDKIYHLDGAWCEAEDYLLENAEVEGYDMVDLYKIGFIWTDGYGYELKVDGQFINDTIREPRYFYENGMWIKKEWFEVEEEEEADGAFFIEQHCDSLGRVIQLYCYWPY